MEYKYNKKMLFIDKSYILDCENKIDYIEEAKTSTYILNNEQIKSMTNVPTRTKEIVKNKHRIHP